MAPNWIKRAIKRPKAPPPQVPPSASGSSIHQPEAQPAPQPASQVSASSSSEPQTSSARLKERLWNQAYDELKLSHRKLVEAYEKILSTQLSRDREGSTGASGQTAENKIGQTHETRWRQMEELVQAGLERTRKEATTKQGIEDKLQAMSAVKEMADKAVRAAPKAAVAWVGVCSGLEMLSNTVTEPGINRRGIAYVISRTAWYWNLATLLLDENTAERSKELRDELEAHIIQLYQKLLLYQMRSVCLYHKNRASIVLGDTIKVHDWANQLKDIQDAEAVVKKDAEQYSTEQIKANLEQLATTAQSREMKLEAIHATMQEQVKLDEKRHQDGEDKQCLKDLCVTDPRDDKERIQETKGGLLKDSYSWIFDNTDFRQWRHDEESRLLWIKGDPGKGKTMLLCGIIDQLQAAMSCEQPEAAKLAYFFCQTTDSRINNATAVLRGLIYILVLQHPLLISHVRSEYDQRGKALFEGTNAWAALSRIFDNILQDQRVAKAYVIIDALDECSTDLERLLRLIVKKSCTSPRFKWIVSSRNWPNIEEQLEVAAQKVRLSLELNQESISAAVRIYIRHQVDRLAHLKRYDEATRQAVEHGLSCNANDTFLWVSLVCHELADPKVKRWHTLKTLNTFPPGLDALYERMLDEIIKSNDAHVCRQMLAVASVVHRPLDLQELSCFVDMPDGVVDDDESLQEMIKLCASFLILGKGTVYFVHQSAKDFVLQKARDEVFLAGMQHTHGTILSNSLRIMSKTLRADLYSLGSPGYPIEQVTQPEPDVLATARYSCVYWIEHLCDWDSIESAAQKEDAPGRSDSVVCNNYRAQVVAFVRKHLLHWLEVDSSGEFYALIHDVKRFILFHRAIVEKAPLQLYSSALLFTPQESIVRRLFEKDLPEWILRVPRVSKEWSPLLQVLESHGQKTMEVMTFSADSKLLAAATKENIWVWDADTGVSLHVLDAYWGDSDGSWQASETSSEISDASWGPVTCLAFSGNGKLLSLHSFWDSHMRACMVWDMATGAGTRVQFGQSSHEDLRFMDYTICRLSPDGKLIVASGGRQPEDRIDVWDIETGALTKSLVGHSAPIELYCVSPDGRVIVSSSQDDIIKLWDSMSGTLLHNLKGPSKHTMAQSMATSGQLVALIDSGTHLYVWDVATGGLLWKKRPGPPTNLFNYGQEVAISSNSKLVACTVPRICNYQVTYQCMIWDVASGTMKQRIDAPRGDANFENLVFSHDGRLLAAREMVVSNGRHIALFKGDGSIPVWDLAKGAVSSTFEDPGPFSYACWAPFYSNCQLLAAARGDCISILDPCTGTTLSTLEHKVVDVELVAFSPDGSLAACSALDPSEIVSSVKFWNIAAGTQGDNCWEYSSATAVSPNCDLIARATKDNKIELWDTAGATVLRTLEGHGSIIRTLVFSADNTALEILEGHLQGILALAFAPDCQRLASTSQDKTVRLWDTTSGLALQILRHAQAMTTMAFSPDGTVLACSDSNCQATFWHVGSGAMLHKLEGPDVVYDFSPNSSLVASASASDGTLAIWSTATGAKPQILQSHGNCVLAVVFSPDGKLLASASDQDAAIVLWDVATRAIVHTLECHSSDVRHRKIIFSPSGHVVAAAAAASTGGIRLWHVATGHVAHDLEADRVSAFTVYAMGFSPDGSIIASVSTDLDLLAWHTSSGAPLEGFRRFEMSTRHYRKAQNVGASIHFSPDGLHWALSLSRYASQVCIWDTSSGRALCILLDWPPKPDDYLTALAVSPNTSSKLAAWSSGEKIVLGSGIRGAARQKLVGHVGVASSLCFCPNGGGVLASSSPLDKTVRLWDVERASTRHVLRGHAKGVAQVAFAPDGKLVASTCFAGAICLWDAVAGTCIASLNVEDLAPQLATWCLCNKKHKEH
ncbi:hypothetical protein CDD81_3878 [Ophiocordyceps australis]|uniref:NACHT domain-containing protein n=1 Tax=Ophiocordyceps australis TaxID=1399860 RepID=A0A2C5YC36_9HYPO|nr:hypothetical protein CDD81_3878 [Ophiocordyceps australis]